MVLFIEAGGLGIPKTFVNFDLAQLSNFQLFYLQITPLPLSTMAQILIENKCS
jgi:hypothetical protein